MGLQEAGSKGSQMFEEGAASMRLDGRSRKGFFFFLGQVMLKGRDVKGKEAVKKKARNSLRQTEKRANTRQPCLGIDSANAGPHGWIHRVRCQAQDTGSCPISQGRKLRSSSLLKSTPPESGGEGI